MTTFDQNALFQAACAARTHAYAPYSGFRVGAALLCEDGRIFTGCNVENAAYPLCTCAERTALCAAISQGARRFLAIAIAGGTDEDCTQPCAPCGG
ncbi:cytidine deaminase, partial [Ruminococcus sp. CAG:379]